MKNNSKTKNYISFISNASCDVTGSCHIIHWEKECIMLDCGIIQDYGNVYSNYQANKERLKKLKPKIYNAVIISHQNADHFAMIPYLFSKGYCGYVYIPYGLKNVIRIMLEDSLKINQSDCIKIQKRGRKAIPFYEQKDIDNCMAHIIEVPYHKIIKISNNISFKYIPAGHLQHSASIYLILENGLVKKRIYYSGDIGGNTPQLYVEPKEKPDWFDVGIVENTYNTPSRPNNPKDREKDLEKIVSIVNEYKRVIIPSFALMRSEIILTELFRLWKNGKLPYDIPVYFNTPLGVKIGDIFEANEEWKEVWNWKNLYKITDYTISQSIQSKDKKCIVVTSAGMCNAGPILSWLKSSLPQKDTHVIFIGYCPEQGIAADIKSLNKEIKIDGELIQNNANYTELRSFSSHADYYELLNFYLSLNFNKICLVHGEQEGKVEFCKTLQNKLVEQGKSARVVCVNEGQRIFI